LNKNPQELELMFQSRRQTTFGNINMGKLSATPSLEDIRFLLEQATRYRARFVEVSWTVAGSGANFQLTTKVLPTQPDPSWMLYRTSDGGSELVWGHSSSDLTLMHNLVMLECERAAGAGSQGGISSGAMESMMASNMSAGAIAGAPTEAQQLQTQQLQAAASGAARTQNQTSAAAQAQAPAAPGGQFGGPDPASTWLRNLSQDPAAYGSKTEEAATAASEPQSESPVMRPITPTAMAAVHSYSAAEVGDRLLDGSLENIAVPNILRYLNENRLTGRLALQSMDGSGEIFFRAGDLKHAATMESKGENALYDIATWSSGFFHFSGEDQTTQTTLAYEANVLVSNCQRMLDYMAFLKDQGVTTASYLDRVDGTLQRHEFEQRLVKNGVACDMNQQWRFFDTINGNLTLSEVLRACPLTRAEWMPIMYNLVRLKLIAITDKPLTREPGAFLEAATLDQAAIEKFLSAATYPGDGLMSKGLFLWLLQQEYYRYERSGARFALVIFSLNTSNMLDGTVSPLESSAFNEACRRILVSKRRLDVVGHFDDDYAMLLPETDSAGAAVFANRILQLWKKPPLTAALEDPSVGLVGSFGIASVPDDVRDLGTLVAAARIAKKKSSMMGASVVLYSQ
jgi:hypothetical protein